MTSSINVAVDHHRAGRLAEAEALYLQILTQQPDNACALNLLGLLAGQRGDRTRARELLQRALSLQPDYADAHNNLGMLLQEQNEIAAAAAHYETALRLNPASAEANTNLGSIYQDLGDFDKALRCYDAAIRSNSQLAPVHNNIGVIHYERGQFAESLSYFQRTIQLAPNFVEAHNNLGNALKSLGRFTEALVAYERATCLDPGFALAQWNRSLVLLLLRRYDEGWQSYDWRFHTKEHFSRHFPYPRYGGAALTGKTLLIYAEQGIGDEVFFAGFFADAIRQAERVIIDCSARLVPMFRRAFPAATVRGGDKRESPDWAAEHGPIDYVISAGSLPRYFAHACTNQAHARNYLSADAGQVQSWKAHLATLGAGKKIGFSWRGGATAQDRGERRTQLLDWEPLLRSDGVKFVCLQYGDCEAELETARKHLGIRVHRFAEVDPLRNLEDFMALVTALDGVVTMANANAHFCGALGIPAAVLVPYSPDFRWAAAGASVPWYPSVRLHRQTRLDSWHEVIGAVAASLGSLGN